MDVPVIFEFTGAFQTKTRPRCQTRGWNAEKKPTFMSQPLKKFFKELWGGGGATIIKHNFVIKIQLRNRKIACQC